MTEDSNVGREHAQHATHAHPETASRAKGVSGDQSRMLIMIASFIIIVVVVALVSYSLGTNAGSGSKPTSTISGSSQISVPTTAPKSNASYAYPTPINASAYPGFVSVSEANTLLGPSNYTAYAARNSSQLNITLASLMPNNVGYKVTSEYIIAYNTYATANVNGVVQPVGRLQELMLQSNNSKNTYSEALKLYAGIFNLTSLSLNANYSSVAAQKNITMSNMTYSFSTYDIHQYITNSLVNYIMVLGFKGNTTAFVSMTQPANRSVNATELASIVANRIK